MKIKKTKSEFTFPPTVSETVLAHSLAFKPFSVKILPTQQEWVILPELSSTEKIYKALSFKLVLTWAIAFAIAFDSTSNFLTRYGISGFWLK